ncbi:negative regulator of systemic acquired resistance SNI1 isoform X2 [Elaeis guineensis]|uniref:Negative regulator of systemic acquired resistance SNI1 isoform X4 n=1 Tax=Elaeis guineensis var. tenera TaxID=51953 RepID=A0A6I9R0K5_ELAGV|nr:negative regulator of systemic acquired resistance SNI1 isoform X4 [Elaeis guineensis]
MENPRITRGGFEENTMAILDSSGIKDARDIHDDRLSFLEAVRFASLASESLSAPSWRMFDAIFQILRDSKSLELAMASYQLLSELEQRYPRIYLTCSDKPESTSGRAGELVVVKEAWSPFIVGSEASHTEAEAAGKDLDHLFDSLRFSVLVEDMALAVKRTDFQLVIKPVECMLLFQYLVNVLEADFLPRQTLYKETSNWVLFRESILNILLGSRKLNFKSLVRDCMSIMCRRCHHHIEKNFQDLRYVKDSRDKEAHNSNVSLAIALSELEKGTCVAVQELMTLIMELDLIRKEADLQGFTTRVDGFRVPMLEIIVDELTYNKDYISPFLMVFSEPKWKLEIILQYFSKYTTKSSVRTRRSNETSNDATLEAILSFFSTATSTKNIVKKISSEVAKLLLVHAFQACLSLQHCSRHNAYSAERIGGTLSQISNKLVSAFQSLRKNDEDLEMTAFEKEALFAAATILSQRS